MLAQHLIAHVPLQAGHERHPPLLQLMEPLEIQICPVRLRSNVTIDWTLRENVRANLRRLVKRVLRKHGYPPDKQESATRTVLEQAEALSAGSGWAA